MTKRKSDEQTNAIVAMLSTLTTTLQGLDGRLTALESTPTPAPTVRVTPRAPAPPLPSRPAATARITPQGPVILRNLPEQPVTRPRPVQVQVSIPTVPHAAPVGPSYSREEQGETRYHKCALCNQDDRMGSVVIATGEYIPTGFTTEYLKNLPMVQVLILNGQAWESHAVSGNWLVDELKRRPATAGGGRVRAISVPAFLAGETGGAHPTLKLDRPLVRRATREEEAAQRVSRAASWMASLDPNMVIEAAQRMGPGGLARLVGAAQDLVAFAGKVTAPLTH